MRQRLTACLIGVTVLVLLVVIVRQRAELEENHVPRRYYRPDMQAYGAVRAAVCGDEEEEEEEYRYLLPGENRLLYHAVASFPRSGGIETLILFQRMTGVYSGSVHYARVAVPPLLVNPGYDDVWVVETHDLAMRPVEDADRYASAIYLVRDPFDAIWCELFLQWKDHPNRPIRFTTTYLAEKLRAWDRHVRFWTFQAQIMGDRHAIVVRYEDLDTGAIRAMVNVTAPEFLERVDCVTADPIHKHPMSCPDIDGRAEILERCEDLDHLDYVMGEIAETVLSMGYERSVRI